LKKGYGKTELGAVTLDMAIGGMRGIPVSAPGSLMPLLNFLMLHCRWHAS